MDMTQRWYKTQNEANKELEDLLNNLKKRVIANERGIKEIGGFKPVKSSSDLSTESHPFDNKMKCVAIQNWAKQAITASSSPKIDERDYVIPTPPQKIAYSQPRASRNKAEYPRILELLQNQPEILKINWQPVSRTTLYSIPKESRFKYLKKERYTSPELTPKTNFPILKLSKPRAKTPEETIQHKRVRQALEIADVKAGDYRRQVAISDLNIIKEKPKTFLIGSNQTKERQAIDHEIQQILTQNPQERPFNPPETNVKSHTFAQGEMNTVSQAAIAQILMPQPAQYQTDVKPTNLGYRFIPITSNNRDVMNLLQRSESHGTITLPQDKKPLGYRFSVAEKDSNEREMASLLTNTPGYYTINDDFTHKRPDLCIRDWEQDNQVTKNRISYSLSPLRKSTIINEWLIPQEQFLNPLQKKHIPVYIYKQSNNNDVKQNVDAILSPENWFQVNPKHDIVKPANAQVIIERLPYYDYMLHEKTQIGKDFVTTDYLKPNPECGNYNKQYDQIDPHIGVKLFDKNFKIRLAREYRARKIGWLEK